jgi:hypothetical protein
MVQALEAVTVEGKPEEYEERNVHAIYDTIAAHFSSTRYKVGNTCSPSFFLSTLLG